ncbi:MAG: response regulator [Thermoguttaceae bacterium]|jgi:CheY-like chemotaxis protein
MTGEQLEHEGMWDLRLYVSNHTLRSVAAYENPKRMCEQHHAGNYRIEATAAIRKLADAKKAGLPIIAMTAHAYKSDQERCLAAGMDAYISKPVNRQELIEMAERIGEGGGFDH